MLNIGEINKLKINRKTDIGYMLEDNDGNQVFLHNNESYHFDLVDGENIDAFLYHDAKGRLAATLATPYVTVSKPGLLEVEEVISNLGVFLDNGISKDVLLSKDDLPEDMSIWPAKGDKVYVYLKVKNKLIAKRAQKTDVKLLTEDKLLLNNKYGAYILRISKEGMNLVTELGHLVFVYKTNIRNAYRIGEAVTVKIVNINDYGYNGSLIENKEEQLHEDANTILSYLIKNQGVMNLTADSSSEEVADLLHISRKAFKRGLGNLYRMRVVDFVEGKTILIEGKK